MYRGLYAGGHVTRRALLHIYKGRIPQRMHVFFPTVEAHVNPVAAAILSEAGMKRLMDVTDEVSDEPQCCALLNCVAHRVT